MGKNLSCCVTSSGDGPKEKCHDSYSYYKMLQLVLQQAAKIAELDLQTKKLQEELSSSRSSHLAIVEENKKLRATISTLQAQKDEKEETIKHLTQQLAQNQLTEKSRARRGLEVGALQRNISELENRELEYKTTIASLENTAHRRLIKASSVQRELTEKRGEVFSLHHRLIEYMDWVAELRGTPFIPLPSYPPNHKPPHKRVRDSWRKMWDGTRLYVVPEEKN